MQIESVVADIAAFADDNEDVVVDKNGEIIFQRGGSEISCTLIKSDEGNWAVRIDNDQISYRQFIARYLGRLDVLAEKLVTKRRGVPFFVDGPVRVDSTVLESVDTTGLSALHRECDTVSPFAARVVFVTGDAGHGKTALLREYQAITAERFLKGEAPFLFWHVDLQGRQLLRLSEALMGDLGDLRIQGLFYPSIITLLRHRALVLAIDGFDELAAEQGSTDALGALSHLLKALDSQGVVVAASRRTFFDTEDYLKRSGMLRRATATQCEIDQIEMRDWGAPEAVAYMSHVELDGKQFEDPQATYNEIITELEGRETHPLVTRPFLLAQTAKALLLYSLTPKTFIRGMQNPLESVAEVIKAFVSREVQEKWRFKETGEPYLTSEQHMRLLSEIAEEMWLGQKDRLDVEAVEVIAVSLFDEWRIDDSRRRQIIEMIRMHVLLVVPPDAQGTIRAFDHPEFRNYFLARSVQAAIEKAVEKGECSGLERLLSVGQLPDSVGKFLTSEVKRDERSVRRIVECLVEIVENAWRPTFLQTNVGTLIPCLIDEVEFPTGIRIAGKIIYSSIVFAGTRFANVNIVGGILNLAYIGEVEWSNVTLTECEASEIRLDVRSTFRDVLFERCRIGGLILMDANEEIRREYAPARIADTLSSVGISTGEPEEEDEGLQEETEAEAALQRLLRVFTRTTGVSENVLRMKCKQELRRLEDDVIPLLEKHELIRVEKWVGSGNQRRWSLTRRVDDILRGAGGSGDEKIRQFWEELLKLA